MTTKPPHGEPCNGCGECCRLELCPLGAVLFDTWRGPCPALYGPVPMYDKATGKPAGDAFTCGVVYDPGQYAPLRVAVYGAEKLRDAARMLIGAGFGCDMPTPGKPPNTAFRERMRRHTRRPRAQRQTAEAITMLGLQISNFWDAYAKR
jgi:hypothetical protein